MESLTHGVFGFRSRADVEAYVTQMNEDAKHSVSWARELPLPALADVAITADDWIVMHGEKHDTYHVYMLAQARNMRRIALDELVRRGAIESYSFV